MIFWLFVLAWAAVGGSLVLVVIPRIVREIRGILQFVKKLSGSSAVVGALSQAQVDCSRISRAVAQLPELRRRALAALAMVRAAKFVPPEVGPLIRRLRSEVAAFRAVVR